MPKTPEDFKVHRYVGYDDADHRAPFARWLAEIVDDPRYSYRATDDRGALDAILAGAGIGFVIGAVKNQHPTLKAVIPPHDDWAVRLWLVTHVDLHRTAKVQTFLSFVKDYAKSWGD